MADRSVSYPRGIVEDVLVKVNDFIFPVDFVVLDMEEDRNIPLILGRPFLATGKAMIDVHKGELTLRINDESVTFSIFNALQKHNNEDDGRMEQCNVVRVIEECTREVTQAISPQDQLEQCALDSAEEVPKRRYEFITLEDENTEHEKSTEEEPKEELKPSPSHLKRMSFGLYNTSATFQRCMMLIFHDMMKRIREVFMDNFSVLDTSFDNCLDNLTQVIQNMKKFYRNEKKEDMLVVPLAPH